MNEKQFKRALSAICDAEGMDSLAVVEKSMFGFLYPVVGCGACGETHSGYEPDTEGAECPSCNEPALVGIEEIMMRGLL